MLCMRSNVYREKVLSVLEGAHLMSITDIQKKVTGADFSTVFRNVEQLVNDGAVKKVVISKDVVLYEANKQNHDHDHFVCNDCGTVESIKTPKIALKGKAIATDVLIRGTCNECVK